MIQQNEGTAENPVGTRQRYLCPYGMTPVLDEDGFLIPPLGEVWGYHPISHLLTYEDVAENRCLVILGEMGIGKTTLLTEIYQQQVGEKVFIDVGKAFDARWVYEMIVNNPNVIRWRQADYELTLFIDALDEGPDRTIEAVLQALYQLPSQRLFVRLSSRTQSWEVEHTNELKSLWKNDTDSSVYVITPLSRDDVRQSARERGVNPDQFLKALRDRGTTAFAAKPITLKMLLTEFLKGDELPQSRRAIYEQGIRRYVQEVNKRLSKHTKHQSTANQRLMVAARLALLTLLSEKSGIDIRIEEEECDQERNDICFSEIGVYSTEKIVEDEFQLSLNTLRETLATPLFSRVSDTRYVWSHRSYQEFLAAYYLVKHDVPLPQLKVLLAVRDISGLYHFPPRLHEFIAWLSAMAPEFKQFVLENEPVVLLHSEAASLTDEEKARIIRWLLESSAVKDHIPQWGEYPHYRKLCHPRLDAQLRPILSKCQPTRLTQRIAIEIAERCGLRSVQDMLVELALNPECTPVIRIEAAHAVGEMGDDESKRQLKPLLYEDLGDLNESKAVVLRALWPEHLSAEELFDVLPISKEQGGLSSFHLFVFNEIIPHLNQDALIPALQWAKHAASMVDIQDMDIHIATLFNGIVEFALAYLDDPNISQHLIEILIIRLKNYQEIFANDSYFRRNRPARSLTQAQRKKLYKLLMTELIIQGTPDPGLLTFPHRFPLIISEDLEWLVTELLPKSTDEEQNFIASTLASIIDWRDYQQIDLVFDAAEEYAPVKAVFSSHFDAIDLASSQAQELRKQYQESEERRQRWARQEENQQSHAPQVSALSEEIKDGHAELWWRLYLELTIDSDGRPLLQFENDIRKLPGWQSADEQTKHDIVITAYDYILAGDSFPEEWFDTPRRVYWPAYAGYVALCLFARIEKGLLEELEPQVWAKWLPAILSAPNGWVDPETHSYLLNLANEKAPEEMIKWGLRLIKRVENEEGVFTTSELRTLETIWHDSYLEALWKILLSHAEERNYILNLLPFLFRHDYQKAEGFLFSLLEEQNAESHGEYPFRVIDFCSVFVRHHLNEGNPWIAWEWIMEKEDELARRILLSLISPPYRLGRAYNALSIVQKERLFVWLMDTFPPDPGDVFTPTARDEIQSFRNSLLQSIIGEGSVEAVEAMQRIAQKYPQYERFKDHVFFARQNLYEQSWKPLSPKNTLELIHERSLRLVRTSKDLLDVVLESLDRLQVKLQHSETPAAIDLWNETFSGKGRPKRYTPKDENRLSDYIKRHLEADLKDRGIIAFREVEIRRGQKTDISVIALAPKDRSNETEILEVVIEVKGRWHPDLEIAMQTQLVERYMQQNGIETGLYLVGWFDCEHWDKKDGYSEEEGRDRKPHRRIRACKRDKQKLDAHLHQEAVRLSSETITVRHYILDASLSSS